MTSMRVVIAPDSFKGSLSAKEVAAAVAEGVLRAVPDARIDLVPLADGGEGTVEALVTATGGRIVPSPATDPLGSRIESFYGVLGDGETAVIEMAAASGLSLVPDGMRNPMITTSYGAGELIRAALDAGYRKLILGIGGSATNDGGVGAMQALGVRFMDASGAEVGFGGGELHRVRRIDVSGMDPRISAARITVACDVRNPLTGPDGASAVFGQQKGATAAMVDALDAGLRNLADVIRRDLSVDVDQVPGAGAAGGMGAACIAFLRADMRPGIDIVLEATHFAERVKGASLVITGEGRIDSQTLSGKTITGVIRSANAAGVPVVALGGGIDPAGYEISTLGRVAVFSIVNGPMSLHDAQANARELLMRAGEQVALLVRHVRR